MDAAKKGRLAKILSFLEDEGPPADDERRPIHAFPDDEMMGKMGNAMLGPIGHTKTEAEYEQLWNDTPSAPADLMDVPPPPTPAQDPLVDRSQVAPIARKKTPRKRNYEV